MKRLPFKVSAKAARLIGRENVSNAEGAIVELVKNTYDADATTCVICFTPHFKTTPKSLDEAEFAWVVQRNEAFKDYFENSKSGHKVKDNLTETEIARIKIVFNELVDLWIVDNGKGMSAEVIENQWMTIGTNYKEENVVSAGGRIRTGAKGIGRFALDRLGSYCTMYTTSQTQEPKSTIKTSQWSVDWSHFEGPGKVLDQVQATLNTTSDNVTTAVSELSSSKNPKIDFDFEKKGPTGTAIQIKFLRDVWQEKDVAHLFKTLSSLVPPDEQKPLKIQLFDFRFPERFGVVSAMALESFDYKLVATIDASGDASVEIIRNELDVNSLPSDLFDREDMSDQRFQLKAFRSGKIIYQKNVRELFLGVSETEIKNIRAIGAFKFTLQFYKLGNPAANDLEKYPYKSFQPQLRRDWIQEHGGIKIYRDDFVVRPYGEPGGKAYDWLGLGQRVASNPVQASRKGWKASPQNLSGTVRISRTGNASISDQSNREGIVDSDAFEALKRIVLAFIKEFEDDRSHIHFNLSELHKQNNASEAVKSQGQELALRIGASPEKATSDDAVKLAKAFLVHEEEIRELKNEQSMLRALATLGTVLVSFSHEMGQLQTAVGSRAKVYLQILKRHISEASLVSIPDSINPFKILDEWQASDQKVKHWFSFALSSIRADKRRRKRIRFRDQLEKTQVAWNGFLPSRQIELTTSIEDGYEPEITAFEIDLDSILNNLILNSVEAFITRDHIGTRSINIHVSEKSKSSMLISYTDSGPGIAPEIKDIRKLLNFGETTKRGKNGDMDGTGIGMWILDSVVNEFGGTVQLFRPSPSWGFKIDIVLPTSPKNSSI